MYFRSASSSAPSFYDQMLNHLCDILLVVSTGELKRTWCAATVASKNPELFVTLGADPSTRASVSKYVDVPPTGMADACDPRVVIVTKIGRLI